MLEKEKLLNKVRQALVTGWSKINVDGVQVVILTQQELDGLLNQAKEGNK